MLVQKMRDEDIQGFGLRRFRTIHRLEDGVTIFGAEPVLFREIMLQIVIRLDPRLRCNLGQADGKGFG